MYTVHVQVHVHREEKIFLHFVYFFYCKQLLVYGLMRRLLDTSYTTRMRPGAELGGGGYQRHWTHCWGCSGVPRVSPRPSHYCIVCVWLHCMLYINIHIINYYTSFYCHL